MCIIVSCVAPFIARHFKWASTLAAESPNKPGLQDLLMKRFPGFSVWLRQFQVGAGFARAELLSKVLNCFAVHVAPLRVSQIQCH